MRISDWSSDACSSDLPPGVAGVASADGLVDEAPVAGEVVEVARAAQQEGVLDGPLEMPVRALDAAVLVGDAGIVAGRRHAVMDAQGVVAAGHVPDGTGAGRGRGGLDGWISVLGVALIKNNQYNIPHKLIIYH